MAGSTSAATIIRSRSGSNCATTTAASTSPTTSRTRSTSPGSSRVRPSCAPEGNGVAERFIRTLKEQLLWVKSFRTIEELRLALHEFRRTYNERWLVERHGHRTPAQIRRRLAEAKEAA